MHPTSVGFEGEFDTASEFLTLNGVHKALIASWTEALVELQASGKLSVHSQHHNWNAVSELKGRIDAGQFYTAPDQRPSPVFSSKQPILAEEPIVSVFIFVWL